jgi:hypothetical protein
MTACRRFDAVRHGIAKVRELAVSIPIQAFCNTFEKQGKYDAGIALAP